MIGCGNAGIPSPEISEKMYDDGYIHIHNIDISPVVINQMKTRNIKRPNMVYQIMDAREMEYTTGTFDLARDKSTIDALLCGE